MIQRSYYFDNLKVVLILLVVIGHLWGFYGFNIPHFEKIYIFIYLFHMPIFVFINGYFSKNTTKPLVKHINQLLIPYIVFELIWWIVNKYVLYLDTIPLLVPYSYLWYLIALFAFRILTKYIVKIPYILPISFILGILSGLINIPNLFGIFKILGFLPFYLLGYFADKNFIDKIRNLPNFIGLLFIIIGMIATTAFIRLDISDVFLYFEKSYIGSGLSNLYGIISRTLLYLTIIIISIGVLKFIPNRKYKMTDIGERTMVIYLGHMFIRAGLLLFIPTWSNSIIINSIILISPFFITWFLSLSMWTKVYNWIFYKLSLKI